MVLFFTEIFHKKFFFYNFFVQSICVIFFIFSNKFSTEDDKLCFLVSNWSKCNRNNFYKILQIFQVLLVQFRFFYLYKKNCVICLLNFFACVGQLLAKIIVVQVEHERA